MPVSMIEKNAVGVITREALRISISLISRTHIINIDKIVIDTHDIKAVIRNVFNTFLSLDLYPITIEKKIIDINIKNSTTTSNIKSVKTQNKENSPTITVDNNNLSVVKNVGDENIISREITRQMNPNIISIIAVKNFDVIIWFFVTGRVWVKYDSSPYKDLEKFKKLLKNGWRITLTSNE